MGSDRQSIMLHENGKKHQQNMERVLKEKRLEKKQEEEANKFIADSLRQMEQAAMQAIGIQPATTASSSAAPPPPLPPPISSSSGNRQEIKEWQAKKKQKEQERKRKTNDDEGKGDESASHSVRKRRRIAPDEGHYTTTDDRKTFLEGHVFHGILEADMPVQYWTGSHLATAEEKKLPSNAMHWQNALVLTVRKKPEDEADSPPVVSVTYLVSPDAKEETIQKNVALDRIRIQVGADDSIPSTLEECRLLAMGGEIVEENKGVQQVMDEATGLSGWSTVTVKKTTVRQYDREEKERAAERLRLAREEREAERKRAEARKMEEAKVSNADDSALGAFDVWGKGDYKGIDISKDAVLSVEDTAKKLASGATAGKVSFRKAKKKKGQAGRRTKSADDD
jgi:WW domain-binding protein 4